MDLRSQKSQSTIEFTIVFSVIIVALILGAQTYVRPAVNKVMENLSEAIKRWPDYLKGLYSPRMPP